MNVFHCTVFVTYFLIIVFHFYLQLRFNHSHWNTLKSLSNPILNRLASEIPSLIKAGKSDNTLKKYDVYFSKFKIWCLKYNLDHLPASVTTISLYLTFLIQSHVSTSVLNSAYYSIKWEHDMNLYDEIFKDNFLKLILDGGVRVLAKPVNKKSPITADILKMVVLKYGRSNDLKDLRICCLMLLGYSGFLRFDELSHIQTNNILFIHMLK